MNAAATSMKATMTPKSLKLIGPALAGQEQILSPQALALIMELHQQFEPRREALLQGESQARLRLPA